MASVEDYPNELVKNFDNELMKPMFVFRMAYGMSKTPGISPAALKSCMTRMARSRAEIALVIAKYVKLV